TVVVYVSPQCHDGKNSLMTAGRYRPLASSSAWPAALPAIRASPSAVTSTATMTNRIVPLLPEPKQADRFDRRRWRQQQIGARDDAAPLIVASDDLPDNGFSAGNKDGILQTVLGGPGSNDCHAPCGDTRRGLSSPLFPGGARLASSSCRAIGPSSASSLRSAGASRSNRRLSVSTTRTLSADRVARRS